MEIKKTYKRESNIYIFNNSQEMNPLFILFLVLMWLGIMLMLAFL